MKRRNLILGSAAVATLGACSDSKFKTYRGPEVTGVVVNKGERKMYLLNDDRVLKDYDIKLGFAPEGHKQIEGDGKFSSNLDQLPLFREHVLVIINHVFGQESVSHADMSSWVSNLKRSCNAGFTLMSVEIDGYLPAARNFNLFRKLVTTMNLTIHNEVEYRIQGQHKNNKIIRQWNICSAA